PLSGASVDIQVPSTSFSRPSRVATQSISANDTGAGVADANGRYSRSLMEGAYTIHVSAVGYTDAWRQIIVPVGAGVGPIDIRLTRRNTTVSSPADGTLSHRADLTLPAGKSATVTSVGAQSLAGLLPLGWSPLAAAE